MEISHRFVEARRVRHHIAETGDGFPIVCLHGWPEFWACWEPLMERLHSKHKLIAIDFRGFGESENPNPEPSDKANARCLADDVIALLDEIGLSRVGFVGHDVSALVMQEIARLRPELCEGLFFFNCVTPGIGSRWNVPEHLGEIWYQAFHQKPFAAEMVGQSEASCRTYIKYFLDHWSYKTGVFDQVIERWTENFMRPDNLQGGFNWYISQNAARLAAMAGEVPELPKIDTPTRVLWGRHDPIIKSDWSDCLDDTFSNVELTFAEEAGHFVHYEMPDLAAGEISRFFAN